MPHILLIEDNIEVSENIVKILELSGYKVSTAPNGKEGVEQVVIQKPDLIICDIVMPILDGYAVLHMLSKNPETSGIPFIFLTANAERKDIRKGMDMGADDYITKPFDNIDLFNAIESRLKKAEALKKEYGKGIEGLAEFIEEIGGHDAVTKFTAGKQVKNYKRKESIYRENDYPEGLFYVNKGKAKVYKTHSHGKELIIELLTEGDFFGYTALLGDSNHAENAEVIEDSEISFIPREEFFTMVYNNRTIAKKFLQILTKNVTEHRDQLLELAYSSVRKRVAESLLLLKSKYEDIDSKHPAIMSVSREDIANIVGTATESLIRTLSDFKEEKLIDIKDGKIFIINQDKLATLKN